VLISSHIIPELEMVCDSAIFINEGLVLDAGSLDELARRHNSRAMVTVRAKKPRELASKLVSKGYVRSVEIIPDGVEVEVAPGELASLEHEISRLGNEYGIDEIRPAIGKLQDLYWKVIGVAK
jgi:ABC-2 type transport system ATP-binding protein